MNKPSAKSLPIGRLILAIGLALIVGVAIAFAFAEEPIGWRDPATGITYDAVEISTIHDDMTYVLALAAGFNITDAKTLQVWDQLVDSEALPGAVVSYTNGGGAFYPSPNAEHGLHQPDPLQSTLAANAGYGRLDQYHIAVRCLFALLSLSTSKRAVGST